MKKSCLTRRVVVAFVALIAVPFVALTCVQFSGLALLMRQQVSETAGLLADQYALRLASRLEKVQGYVNQLKADSDLRRIISDSEQGRVCGETVLARSRLLKSLSLYRTLFDVQAYSICLTTRTRLIRQSLNVRPELLACDVTKQAWFRAALEGRGRLEWGGIHPVVGGEALSVCAAVYGVNSGDIVGTINVAFAVKDIFPQEGGLSESDALLFYHSASGMAYGATPSGRALLARARGATGDAPLGQALLAQEQAYHIAAGKAGKTGWTAIMLSPTRQILSAINVKLTLFLATSLLYSALMFLYWLRTRQKLFRPLESAIAFINENTMYRAALRSDAHGYPEIRAMRQSAVSIVTGRLDAELSLEEMTHQKDMARMKQFQMQINPHFLYNTLNSIKILADSGAPQDVSRLIYHMIHLLNACMDRSGRSVTVRQELETLRHYYAIEQVVYGDSVRFEEDVPPALYDVEIPNFILQPIVENSLMHGLDFAKKDNWVRVSARAREGALAFTVEDNGVGIPPEKLRQLERDIQRDEPEAHIGICSVHRRIQLGCGRAYGIRIASPPGKGATFTIRLPLRRRHDEEGRRHVSCDSCG